MCQHRNYHHTSRFLSTPTLGKHGGSSRRDKHPSHEFRSQQYFPYCSPAQFIRVCFDLWPDLTSTLRMSHRKDSKVTALGLRVCEKWRTNLRTDTHTQENICTWEQRHDLWCLQLVEQMLMVVHQKVNKVYHSKRKKTYFFKICPGKHHTRRVGHHDLWPGDFLCKSMSGRAKILN